MISPLTRHYSAHWAYPIGWLRYRGWLLEWLGKTVQPSFSERQGLKTYHHLGSLRWRLSGGHPYPAGRRLGMDGEEKTEKCNPRHPSGTARAG